MFRIHRLLYPALVTGATALFATACASGPALPPFEEQLYGSWEWVRSEHGTGQITTPTSEGYGMCLTIFATSWLEVTRDHTVEAATSFFFLTAQDLDDSFVPARLRTEAPVLGATEHGVAFDGTHLVMYPTCCAGTTYVWSPARSTD